MSSNSEDLFIKPGNQERGWNDPPQFSYGLQNRGAPRSVLPRRAPPAGSGAPSVTPPSSALTPPRSCVAPPPLCPGPPPIGSSPAPPLVSGPISAQSHSAQLEPEPDLEEVMSVLNAALEACRQNSERNNAQVLGDVAKRLTLFQNSWRSCRLSLAVRRRMKKLSDDLKSGLWDSADDTHRSLMVDHVTEVSQWMVGVKRLIAETRKLGPDQLKPLIQDPNQDSSQDRGSTGLDQDRPTDKDQESTDPDQGQSTDQDPSQSTEQDQGQSTDTD